MPETASNSAKRQRKTSISATPRLRTALEGLPVLDPAIRSAEIVLVMADRWIQA